MASTHIRNVSVLILILVIVSAGAVSIRGERIFVVAESEVPLYDPGTVAGSLGTVVKTVGTLGIGAQAPVVSCNDRKSDIDIQVQYEGNVAVLGGSLSQVKLHRSGAYLWEAGVTTSCLGLFTQADAPRENLR